MRRPSRLAALTVVTLAAGGVGLVTGVAAAAPGTLPGEPRATYVVTVDRDTLPAQAADRARGLGGSIDHVYSAALRGYAVTLPEAAAGRLAAQPGVVAVERDQVFRVESTQPGAPWGLDRTDQAAGLDGDYTYTRTGAGVTAYVIDSGIRSTHSEFTRRVRAGANYVSGKNTTEDCNGHGTHVAGTIGGSTYGVAKGVTLVPVRVLNCQGSGTTSGVVAGIEWVTKDHAEGTRAVANMSLGGGLSSAIDNAVTASIADGVTYAVAAGNAGADVSTTSPARVPAALTVAASDRADGSATFTNHGTGVDLYAPGVDITSAWSTGNTARNTISGTSMAAPHVAGVAALYLESNPGASPTAVQDALIARSTLGRISGEPAGTPDRLLFSGY